MSRESDSWLNLRTLIGYALKRGKAWHYREALQGAESNHYDLAIPVEDVIRRLFNFSVIEAPMHYYFQDELKMADNRKLMVADDTGDVLGVFKNSYSGHGYKEWLLENVAAILDDELNIGSAGLLKNRAVAWVSLEMPESITTPEGVAFRPHLLATTSYDGSIATTYKRCVQLVVCDNTRDMALGEKGQVVKVKHSKYSNLKLGDAREALAMVHTMADDFAAEVAALTSWKVSEADFAKHLDVVVPLPVENGEIVKGRGATMAEKKRDQIITLYRSDDRVAPWRGTAFGVLQAHNTWQHHFATVRKGIARGQRNMENVVNDKYATADAAILATLQTVTA